MRRLRGRILPVLLACGLVLLAAHPVFAAQEGGETSPLTGVFQWINFAIVAGLIVWLLVKKAPGVFAARVREIRSAIEEAAKVKAQADAQRREAEQRLANLASEIEEMRAEARREAATEAGRMQAATQEEAAKIDRAARLEVEAAGRSALAGLRALASRLSLERAEAVLRAEMTPAAEEGMFATFLGELPRPGGQGGRRN
ncbi:MAG TPA: ATP synthase F0 subunit B [Candidatus Acidoferrales bacterium]|nr:ATP synthase F0 subunit B [Candidatus Acidoferrales bacterium]